MKRYPNAVIAVAIIAVSFAFVYGCGKEDGQDEKNVIARVNKEPIYSSDLKREIALRAQSDPTFRVTPETSREQLEVMINKKLIIQEAMKAGLVKAESFVNTIKTFWEQTLIRDFVNFKRKELEKYLFANDEEVKQYYDNMGEKVTFRIVRSQNKDDVQKVYQKYMSDKDTSQWQTVGPLEYEDIASGVLLDAFEMKRGEVKEFDDPPNYFVIQVLDKTAVEIAPLDELRPEIEKRVIARKDKKLLEDWLKEKRENAKVDIDKAFSK